MGSLAQKGAWAAGLLAVFAKVWSHRLFLSTALVWLMLEACFFVCFLMGRLPFTGSVFGFKAALFLKPFFLMQGCYFVEI